MSVRITPARSGRGFEYDLRFVWPEGGSLRERGKSPCSGKDASRRWAEQREAHIRTAGKAAYHPLHYKPELPKTAIPTLADFWPRFVRDHYRAERLKESTVSSAEQVYRTHLGPALGSTPLHQITTAEVAALKGRLCERSPKTCNNVLAVLSRCLRSAVDWGVLSGWPCKIELLKVQRPEMDWYEVHDYRRLVEGAGKVDTATLCLVLLAGSAGLRQGELKALSWTDIDFTRGQLTVSRGIWKTFEAAPKGGRSRIVPLTGELVAALKAHRHLGARVLAGEREDGSVSKQTLQLWMRRAQRRAGMAETGKLHILRHTFCSHLALAGVPANAIQQLAGHADLGTSMRYLHLSPSNRSAAMGTLAAFYAETGS